MAGVKFKKGLLVLVRPILNYRGEPQIQRKTGKVEVHRIWRDRTEADHAVWWASDDSQGMDSAGESKLDNPSRSRVPDADEVFRITRARVTAQRGWHLVKKCAEVEDSEGVRWFVKREHLH